MKKIGFVFAIACAALLLSGCGGMSRAIQRNQARSAHRRAVSHAHGELLRLVPHDARIWVHNRTVGMEAAYASGVADDLVSALMQSEMTLVDRESAELIARELDIQLSGDVRDSDIVMIGHQIGATHLATINIVTTNPRGTGIQRRLQMRVLNIETGALLLQSDTGSVWRL